MFLYTFRPTSESPIVVAAAAALKSPPKILDLPPSAQVMQVVHLQFGQ
jgi:hypothetical protein